MALEFNTNLFSVTSTFLKQLDIPISKTSLKTMLVTNPYYPSLYALGDVFDRFHIDNKSLHISSEQLDDIALPFLAYIDIPAIGAKDFVTITDVKSDSVTYRYRREETISRTDFLARWSNIVFLAQATASSNDVDYDKNRTEEIKQKRKSLLVVLGFSLLLFAGVFSFIHHAHALLQSSTYVGMVFLGLAATVLLVIHEVDKSNAFVKHICEGGTKTNCDAVLGSDASRLFTISWSELGFFYFGFLMLYGLIPFVSYEEKKPVITLLTLVTAAYIPFSIYYQYTVVKQWCRLCLVVQATLFSGLMWAIAFGNFRFQRDTSHVAWMVGCAIVLPLVWYALKPLLIKAIDSEKYFAAYKRLWTNAAIFKVVISEQHDAPHGWETIGIHKGADHADTVLLKICSPTCGPCATAHGVFNDIIANHSTVKIITLYDVDPADENDFKGMFVKYMLALSEHDGGKNMSKAMDYWYLTKDRDFDVLTQMYPVPGHLLEKQYDKIEAMRVWCKEAEVHYTPTVYLNGKKLPRDFHLEELKAIL